jgi:hypothetical protein
MARLTGSINAKVGHVGTVGAAYGFVFGHPLRFFRAAWPWFALMCASFLISAAAIGPPSQATALAIAFTVGFIVLASFVSVSVAIHRSIILGEGSWRAPLRFGRRQLRFLGSGLIIALLLGGAMGVSQWIFWSVRNWPYERYSSYEFRIHAASSFGRDPRMDPFLGGLESRFEHADRAAVGCG